MQSKKHVDSEFICKITDMMEVSNFLMFRNILTLFIGMKTGQNYVFKILIKFAKKYCLNTLDIQTLTLLLDK